jgi:hypothetical protein
VWDCGGWPGDDASLAGPAVLLRQRGMRKKTFAEQVPGLTIRHGRWTNGLRDALRAVALALGGRAGARLAGQLAAGVSRMTLIRLIRALPAGRDGRAGGPGRG